MHFLDITFVEFVKITMPKLEAFVRIIFKSIEKLGRERLNKINSIWKTFKIWANRKHQIPAFKKINTLTLLYLIFLMSIQESVNQKKKYQSSS